MGKHRARLWAFLLVSILLLSNVRLGFSKHKLPDLAPSGLTSDTSAIAGGSLQNVSLEVLNQGKRAAGAFRARFYLSTDTVITTGDIDTGSGCQFTGLAKGESMTCSAAVNIPSTIQPGTYFLGVIVDDLNAVEESDKSNNPIAFGRITIQSGSATAASGIQIDGNPDDWKAIPPIVS